MNDIDKTIADLKRVAQWLFDQYREANDRSIIAEQYDRFLAVNDAIQHLEKAKPHVMTYEEACKNANEYGNDTGSCRPVYVQFSGYTDCGDETIFPPWKLGPEQRALLSHSDYGNYFRFWTDRPTYAQEIGTEWNA